MTVILQLKVFTESQRALAPATTGKTAENLPGLSDKSGRAAKRANVQLQKVWYKIQAQIQSKDLELGYLSG